MVQTILSIRGIPVYVGSLPSGDLKIWHPHNDQVRAIVEPLCRGRGYWNPDYNNWIIRQQCKDSVIAALRAEEVRHG